MIIASFFCFGRFSQSLCVIIPFFFLYQVTFLESAHWLHTASAWLPHDALHFVRSTQLLYLPSNIYEFPCHLSIDSLSITFLIGFGVALSGTSPRISSMAPSHQSSATYLNCSCCMFSVFSWAIFALFLLMIDLD